MNPPKQSFLPEDYVEKRIEKRTNMICLSLFGVVLLGVIGAYLVTRSQRASVLEKQRAISARYTEAAQRLAQLEELRQRKQQLLRKAQISATLVEPIPRSNLLADIINRMPDSLSLLEMTLTSKKLAPAHPAANPKKTALANAKARQAKAASIAPLPVPRYRVTINLVGVAPTDVQVATFMAELARSPLLKDVNLQYSEEKHMAEVTMRKFKISAELDGDADVREIQPLIKPRPNAGSAFGTLLGKLRQTLPGAAVAEAQASPATK